MPRARNIKPSFFVDEELVELSFSTRLLFIGLWTLADREGRLPDKPKSIKMSVFPSDRVDVDKGLDELAQAGFLRRYVVDSKGYIEIRNFAKHQRPHPNEAASEFPPPPPIASAREMSEASSEMSEPIRSSLPSSSCLLNSESPTSSVKPDEDVIFEYWQKTLNHPIAKFTKERKARVRDRLRSYSVDDICRAIDGCKASPHHQGQNDRNTVFDDLELICRNDTQLEKFMGYLGNGKVVPERPNDFDLQKRIERENAPRGEKWAN